MKKLLVLALACILIIQAHTQVDTLQYQSTVIQFREWFNKNETDSLYTLLSPEIILKIGNKENWNAVMNTQIIPVLGTIAPFIFNTFVNGSVVFKGASENPSLCLELSINKNFQVNGLHILQTSASSLPKPRPQTPVPPYAYNSEDAEYDNADKSVHFGATFTYPKTGGPFVTAILITGSGQQDRDETIIEHKPFAVIADYLTKQGIAVLRVDDRGVGKTTGLHNDVTSADFANDVEAGLAYLKKRNEVDKNKIGLIGHSEGGLIASIVASRNRDINFVIMLAGPGINGEDLMAEQDEAIFLADGVSNEAATIHKNLYKKILDSSLASNNISEARDKIMNYLNEWKKDKPQALLDTLGFANDSAIQKFAVDFAIQGTLQWMKYFLRTNPQSFIEKIRAKVLALNGSKDIQVIASSNLAGIKQALAKRKSPDYEVKELPGLNHLFQHCNKCTAEEYGELEETFAPEVLGLIGNWIKEKVVSSN